MPSSSPQQAILDQKIYKQRRRASLSLNIKYASFYIKNRDILNKELIKELLDSLTKQELELLDWLEPKIKEDLI